MLTESADCPPIAPSLPRRAHLIGIAGNGMRALADVFVGWGWTVSGSDLDPSPAKHLVAAGAREGDRSMFSANRLSAECVFRPKNGPVPSQSACVSLFRGHAAEHLPPDAELVVYSDAVPPDNPELRLAVERGIEVLSYFQMLGRLGVGRNLSAIAGTHGKSTATAMTAHLLVQAGLDPTVVCGATPLGAASGGRAGSSNMMLVEACEYRANFLRLRPQQAVILGIEPDHFDCYGSLDELEAAFGRFAASVPANGLLLASHDCPSTRRAAAQAGCKVETFGLSPDADWSASDIKPRPSVAPPSVAPPPQVGVAVQLPPQQTSPQQTGATDGRGFMGRFQFEIHRFGSRFCEVRLQVPGRHNVVNALAAAALACENGLSASRIAAGLGNFTGLHRRMELLGERRGVAVLDDYAHHPTEVRAALSAARMMFPGRRLWCVFQPHQASRTERLLDELAESMQNADKVLVADIFRAREGHALSGGVTSGDLARKAAAAGVEVLPGHTNREITVTLETQLSPGDVLITLGAGEMGGLRPWAEDEG
ncbi:MAG: UDP-N-acetylmuramate--L-alanine ligase [Pirellulales bacterium]|nr:UDP-N-acetylmuramate--L-alanine ligase [Pirellulales bacterium]